MTLLDDLGRAMNDFVEGLARITDRAAEKSWASRLPALESAGIQQLRRKNYGVHGTVPGASVIVTLYSDDDHGWRTNTTWKLDTPIDGPIQLATPSPLDRLANAFGGVSTLPAVRFDSRHRGGPFLMTDRVRALAEDLAAHEHSFALTGKTFTALVRGDDMASISTQVALLRELVDRWAARASELEALGLTQTQDGEWTGTIEGVPLRVLETRRGASYTTAIHARLRHPLPADTCIEKKRKTKEPRNRHRIGDMVLDMALEGRSSDMAATRDRIAREPVRSELLGLLGTWSGSWLGAEELVVRLPGAVVDACEVPAIVSLVRAVDA